MSDIEITKRVLSSWDALNSKALFTLTAQDLRRAIEIEMGNGKRSSYVTRLERRLWRVERESRKKELTKKLSKVS